MATVTLNTVVYTDDDNATTGMANGGHRTRLIPMFGNAIIDVGAKKDAAASSAAAAVISKDASVVAKDASVVAKDAAVVAKDASVVAKDAAVVAKDAAAVSAAQAAASAAALAGTSTTSLLIALGSKVFTTQASEAYTAGSWVTATSAANLARWMYGQITSYSGTTLTVDVQVINGSGTYADWNLSISAARGATGPTGPVGPTGGLELVFMMGS